MYGHIPVQLQCSLSPQKWLCWPKYGEWRKCRSMNFEIIWNGRIRGISSGSPGFG